MQKNNYKRQESRLDETQTIFIETQSAYKDDPGSCRMLVCQSVDISANGFRAHIDRSVSVNAIYQVCVELHQTGRHMYLAAQVKWLKSDGDGFQAGFQIFESEDTDVQAWKHHVADCLTRV